MAIFIEPVHIHVCVIQHVQTHVTYEDGLSGSGKYKCKNGFTGEKCNIWLIF